MNRRHLLAAASALAAAALLPGCAGGGAAAAGDAGGGDAADTGRSAALQIMRGAGYRRIILDDAPGPLPAGWDAAGAARGGYGGPGPAAGLAGALVDAGGLASTLMSPLAGFTALSGGLLAGGGALLRPETLPEERKNALLAWMPASQAASADEARARLLALAHDPFLRAVRDEAGLRGALEPVPIHSPPDARVYRFREPAEPCADPRVACQVVVGPRSSPRRLSGSRVPSLIRAAAGIGETAEVWAFDYGRALGVGVSVTDNRGFGQTNRAVLPSFDAMLALSRELPAWAAMYVAPLGAALRDPAQGGRVVFLQAPIVLHQGRVLPFVRGAGALTIAATPAGRAS